jgi:hypothetical protein
MGSLYDPGTGYTGGSMDILDWFTGEVRDNQSDNFAADVQGILQNDLTLADRKFMYGYLKRCFANNHQLFLLFVRAESAAGGGGAGSGARAVALVWRDPTAPREATGRGHDNASKYLNLQNGINEESWRLNERKYPPHRMRVLFYHQLD